MKYVGITIGLLFSFFFVVIEGASESKGSLGYYDGGLNAHISEDDPFLHQSLLQEVSLADRQKSIQLSNFLKAQQTIQCAEGVTFFEYIPRRKEYLIAHHDKIFSKRLADNAEQDLFTCDKDDLIRSVQYRPEYDDLIVATKKELFLLSVIAETIKKELYRIPQNHYIRSIEQLPYNRLLMMSSDHIRCWDFESNMHYVLADGDRSLKFVAGQMDKQRLLFTENQHVVVYDLETHCCTRMDMKKPIQSVIYKNGLLYAMTEHSVLRYDLEKNICKRLIAMPYDSLRSFSCNNDGTKLLMRTDQEVILHDIINSKQTILHTDSDHIWSLCFYDKDDNQYIVRTAYGMGLCDIKTGVRKMLFKKDEKENALFSVCHNKKRDELLVTTMRRAILLSFATQKLFLLQTLPDNDYIKSAKYDESGTHVLVGSMKGRYALYDLVHLDACEQLEKQDLKAPDISIASDQVDEYEKLFEEHDARAGAPSQSNNYHILITGCLAVATWLMSSFGPLY